MIKKIIALCVIGFFLCIQGSEQVFAGVSDLKRKLDQKDPPNTEIDALPGTTNSNSKDPFDFEVEFYFDDIMYRQTTATKDEVLRKAHAGDARSQFLMGDWLAQTTSKFKAVEWYNKAAKQKNADALLGLAKLYAEGEVVSKDLDRAEEYSLIAVRWLTEAATKGDIEAQNSLGDFYSYHSKSVNDETPDKKTAARWYEMAAEKGHIWAQIELGFLHLFGKGVPQDGNRAAELFAMVDSKRLPHSSFWMSMQILISRKCPKSGWIYKFAEKGDSWAQYLLGNAHEDNLCAPEDKTKAVEWYLKAAEQGNPDAQFALGNMYSNGTGIKADMIQAFKWYEKASKQNHTWAKRSIEYICKNRPWACN